MRRRIVWKFGDSQPVYGHLIAAIQGDGDIRIVTGFPVSAAQVSFSKNYNRYLVDTFGYDYEKYAFAPEVYVSGTDDEGFTITYKNIPDSLEINYFVV
jgi:hypothetical protein